jgi:hypothetical protein
MLTFTVIEIAPQDGYAIIRVQVGSTTPDITTGDAFGMAVTLEIAALNVVGEPFVETAPPPEE